MPLDVHKRIENRRKLVRSLVYRGIVPEDYDTRGISSSIYGQIKSTIERYETLTSYQISNRAKEWYSVLNLIYKDASLEKPEGWDEFINTLYSMSIYPERYMTTPPLQLEYALEDFVDELMIDG